MQAGLSFLYLTSNDYVVLYRLKYIFHGGKALFGSYRFTDKRDFVTTFKIEREKNVQNFKDWNDRSGFICRDDA